MSAFLILAGIEEIGTGCYRRRFRKICGASCQRSRRGPLGLYDHSKEALDASIEMFERSFDAAGQGAAAFNRKIIDSAQRNVMSGFDLAKSLAGAKNLAEAMELQAAYWRKQFGALAAQAEEVRALSTKVTADTAEPIKAHVTRGMNEMRKAS